VVAFPQIFGVGDQPVAMHRSTTNPTRWWVGIKAGIIKTLTFDLANPSLPTVTNALDISAKVVTGPESGFGGMVFHPSFPMTPFIYVHYSGPNTPGATGPFTEYISRFTTNDGGLTFDPASEQILITLPQHGIFHHGGKLVFGADGFLYVGF